MRQRAAAKHLVERALERGGVAAAARWLARCDTLVLAYHDIVPDDAAEPAAGDRPLHLPRRAFAAQLDALRATHDVISLEGALADVTGADVTGADASAPRSRRPRAVITFDDAYRGAVTCGVAELAARALPATIFVAPAFVGGGTFWWDALAGESSGLDPAVRAHALHELRGCDADVRRWAAASGLALGALPPHACCASEGELARAAATPGITLASHGWSHANLTRLDGRALREELERPLAWLRERFAGVPAVLSYPYGLSSPAVERAAAAAGYRAAMRISGGWLRAGAARPHALPRLDIPAGLSRAGFVLRAAGVLRA